MYYFNGKVNREQVVCPLYGGRLYLGGLWRFHCINSVNIRGRERE